ncbi:hypothetical protein KP509_09G065600 [Ceratopteris richardii]|uniref:Auxin-responsive protein n=1 Tax=Ceratopteris richardii TaxID=49495 RepID=A0A8T2U7M8_CERRI|nr:hypothetical protein KP509_09G065600 [Ceratopteris richardii]
MGLLHQDVRHATTHSPQSPIGATHIRDESGKTNHTGKVITLFGNRLTFPHEHHEQITMDNPPPKHTESDCTYALKRKDVPIRSKTIKVSIDGVPYMRKMQLGITEGYRTLAIHLDQLFRIEKSELHSLLKVMVDRKTHLSLTELQNACCILTYMDDEGDWMLVGDTPWEFFIESVERLHIMRRSVSHK